MCPFASQPVPSSLFAMYILYIICVLLYIYLYCIYQIFITIIYVPKSKNRPSTLQQVPSSTCGGFSVKNGCQLQLSNYRHYHHRHHTQQHHEHLFIYLIISSSSSSSQSSSPSSPSSSSAQMKVMHLLQHTNIGAGVWIQVLIYRY